MGTHTVWAARLLSGLLREGDGPALLGDLEERARRVNSGSSADAARWYRRELYWSLAAVLRLRSVECVRAVPWAVVAAAYIVVGIYEFAAVWLLSRTWPAVAEWTSAVRLVLEFPGIIAIAYAAATFRRSAAFVLGAVMLCVAALLNSVTTEEISTPYVIASLVVGPLGAVVGGLLRRGPIVAASAMALFVSAGVVRHGRQRERSATDIHGRRVEDQLRREKRPRSEGTRRLCVSHRQVGRRREDQASRWEGRRVPDYVDRALHSRWDGNRRRG